MISVTDPTGATTRFTFDNAGNMLAQMDSAGNTTEYAYDSLNRLIKLIDPNGSITTIHIRCERQQNINNRQQSKCNSIHIQLQRPAYKGHRPPEWNNRLRIRRDRVFIVRWRRRQTNGNH